MKLKIVNKQERVCSEIFFYETGEEPDRFRVAEAAP